MAKIKDLDALTEQDTQETSEKEKAFIKNADMKKTTKGKGGRPMKAPEDRATEQIFVNVTAGEKEKIESFAKAHP
jgi:hypothetical protein